MRLERAASRVIRHAGEAVVSGAKRLRPRTRRELPEGGTAPDHDPDDLGDD